MIKIKNHLLVIAGSISLALGIIGIFVPVLPTTPFLLLAAICYLRGSKRLYHWLLNVRFIGNYIRNYVEGGGMSRNMKIWTLGVLWLAIILTAIFIIDNTFIRIILGVVLIGVTLHILLIKTIKG